MTTSLNLAPKKPTQAVATKPVHLGILSHISTAIFQALHVHSSNAVVNAATNTGDEALFSDPVVKHIISDLEKMLTKKFAAYEATQRKNVASAQAAAKVAEPIPIICGTCARTPVATISVDDYLKLHPNSPEPEQAVVHSLPMEIEKPHEAPAHAGASIN